VTIPSICSSILVIALSLLPALTYAEIYRWTDSQGKTHFSDQPPEQGMTSDEVSKQLPPLNRDTSTKETEKLQQLFQGATPEEQALQQQQQVEPQRKEQKINSACQKARQELRTIKGRVFFTDKNGKQVIVSEDEREQRADRLEQQIKQYCP
jgi:hypothetical protein